MKRKESRRKVVAVLCSAAVAVGAFGGAVFAEKSSEVTSQKEIVYGDADGNGNVTLPDAKYILKWALRIDSFSDEQALIADVDGNNTVDLIDAKLVLKKSLGIINVFPVEKEYENGNVEVCATGYESIAAVYKDTIVASQNDKWGIVRFDGTQIVPFEYDGITTSDVTDEITVFWKKGKVEDSTAWNYGEECKNYYAYDSNGNVTRKSENVSLDAWMGYSHGVYYGDWIESGEEGFNPFYDADGKHFVNPYVDGVFVDLGWGGSSWCFNYNPSDSKGAYTYGDLWAFNDDKGKEHCFFVVSKDGIQMYTDERLNFDEGEGYSISYACGDYVFMKYKEEYNSQTYDIYSYKLSTKEINLFAKDLNEDTSFDVGIQGDGIIFCNSDENNGKYRLYDYKGNVISSKEYDYMESDCGEKKYYLVGENGSFFYIDAEGNEYGREYTDAGAFWNGKAIVRNQDGKAYIIDENFDVISEGFDADGVSASYSDGHYIIKRDGLMYAVKFSQ